MRLLLAIATCVSLAAQGAGSVSTIISVVRTALEHGQTDAQLARVLHRVKPAEALDMRTVEELENLGAGPRTLTELEHIREISAGLPAPIDPSPFPTPAPPSEIEQQRTIETARASAITYEKSLPDFICTEVVRRYNDSIGKQVDTLELKVSFFGQKESYQLLTINKKRTSRTYDSIGGTITQGEFGSLLNEVFALRSETEFRWDHWTNIRRRPTLAFYFRVRAGRSRYRMQAGTRFSHYEAVVGQHGFVYIDAETHQTVRVFAEAESIPSDFPVRSAMTKLDYGFVDIGERRFLLPLHAETQMQAEDNTRNDVQFLDYKKFSSDATITFEPGK